MLGDKLRVEERGRDEILTRQRGGSEKNGGVVFVRTLEKEKVCS